MASAVVALPTQHQPTDKSSSDPGSEEPAPAPKSYPSTYPNGGETYSAAGTGSSFVPTATGVHPASQTGDSSDLPRCGHNPYFTADYYCSSSSLYAVDKYGYSATGTGSSFVPTATGVNPASQTSDSPDLSECGPHYYHKNEYKCYFGKLCRIHGDTPELLCGDACYQESLHCCKDGALITKTDGICTDNTEEAPDTGDAEPECPAPTSTAPASTAPTSTEPASTAPAEAETNGGDDTTGEGTGQGRHFTKTPEKDTPDTDGTGPPAESSAGSPDPSSTAPASTSAESTEPESPDSSSTAPASTSTESTEPESPDPSSTAPAEADTNGGADPTGEGTGQGTPFTEPNTPDSDGAEPLAEPDAENSNPPSTAPANTDTNGGADPTGESTGQGAETPEKDTPDSDGAEPPTEPRRVKIAPVRLTPLIVTPQPPLDT
ncbi:MAG: hypothetical protein Q9185_005180 [Variospora sp. 1 TL-2023]